MSITHPLFEEAQQIVSHIEARASEIKRELSDMDAHYIKLRAELHAANDAPQRLSAFVYEEDGRLYCPRCWIENEVRTEFRAIPGDDRKDNFTCPTCSFEYSQLF